jgi:hypothetical protein
VSIAFAVDRTLAVTLRSDGLGGILLDERLVDSPYVKDHDGEGEEPTHWPERFDTSRWGLIAAHDVDRRVGGAVIAFQSSEVWMLEGRATRRSFCGSRTCERGDSSPFADRLTAISSRR